MFKTQIYCIKIHKNVLYKSFCIAFIHPKPRQEWHPWDQRILMVLYRAMETYQPRPLWNTGLHTAILGYILKYRGGYRDRSGTLGARGY